MLLAELLGVKRFHHMSKTELLDFINQSFSKGETKLKWIGAGVASSVLTDGTDIYKFWLKDSAYDAFLDYVVKNQSNPYLPKLKGKPRTMPAFHLRAAETPDLVKWVKMEKLEPSPVYYKVVFGDVSINVHELADDLVTKSHRLRDDNTIMSYLETSRYVKLKSDDSVINDELMLFAQTAIDIGKLVKGDIQNDLTTSNIMMRAGAPVFIDPLASDTDHKFNHYLDGIENRFARNDPPPGAASGRSKS
jgi:hypothetical protein